jgi:hypothetical protein
VRRLLVLAGLGALLAFATLAEATPTQATTNGSSAVSETSATISGTVASDESPFRYRFEYGTTTSYNSFTAERSVSSAGTYEETLTGLSPGTTYHYRVSVYDTAGRIYGDDATFTTATPPPPPPPPDGDHDGYPDSSDACPSEAGPSGGNGCPPPPPDLDHDGYPDSSDACPSESGPSGGNGCPPAPAPQASYGAQTGPAKVDGSQGGSPLTRKFQGRIASFSGSGSNTFSYRFQYGRTTAYGAVTPLAQATTTNAEPAADVSRTVTDFEPATTYHYRIVVVKNSNNETVIGNDESFTIGGYRYVKPANSTTTSDTVGPGGTVRTGTDPSKAHPIEVSVEAEKGGKVYIDEIKGADRPGDDPDAEVNPEDDSPKDKNWYGPQMRIVPPREGQFLKIVFTIDHASDLADHRYREYRLADDPVRRPGVFERSKKVRYRSNGDTQITYRLEFADAGAPVTFDFYNPGWGVLGGENFGDYGSSLDTVLKQGYIDFSFLCVQKCARTITASINEASAEKLGINNTLKVVHTDYGKDFNRRVPLSRKVRRALGRAAQITIIFHAKAVGPNGQVLKKGFKMRLKRDEDESDSIG